MIYKPGNCKNFFTTYFGIRKPTKLFLHWSISLEENYDAWDFVFQNMANLEAFPFDILSGIKLLFLKSMARFFLVENSIYYYKFLKITYPGMYLYLTAFSRKFSSMFDHLQIHSCFITILVYLDSRIKNKNFCQDLFFFLQAYASFWKNYKKYI